MATPARALPVSASARIDTCDAAFDVTAPRGPLSSPETLLAAVRQEILPALSDVLDDPVWQGIDVAAPHIEIDLGAWPDDPNWSDVRATLVVKLRAALEGYIPDRVEGPAAHSPGPVTKARPGEVAPGDQQASRHDVAPRGDTIPSATSDAQVQQQGTDPLSSPPSARRDPRTHTEEVAGNEPATSYTGRAFDGAAGSYLPPQTPDQEVLGDGVGATPPQTTQPPDPPLTVGTADAGLPFSEAPDHTPKVSPGHAHSQKDASDQKAPRLNRSDPQPGVGKELYRPSSRQSLLSDPETQAQISVFTDWVRAQDRAPSATRIATFLATRSEVASALAVWQETNREARSSALSLPETLHLALSQAAEQGASGLLPISGTGGNTAAQGPDDLGRTPGTEGKNTGQIPQTGKQSLPDQLVTICHASDPIIPKPS